MILMCVCVCVCVCVREGGRVQITAITSTSRSGGNDSGWWILEDQAVNGRTSSYETTPASFCPCGI
jgi:hypothetical protein